MMMWVLGLLVGHPTETHLDRHIHWPIQGTKEADVWFSSRRVIAGYYRIHWGSLMHFVCNLGHEHHTMHFKNCKIWLSTIWMFVKFFGLIYGNLFVYFMYLLRIFLEKKEERTVAFVREHVGELITIIMGIGVAILVSKGRDIRHNWDKFRLTINLMYEAKDRVFWEDS
ncbi:hypothetical protein BSL78_28725 [Apostichopus japonicus]|uniref:Uncharacterized protein n=1 Tax=Stichopus japonicus TaxID=307972 RepID=A0A2G8JFE4_STIJA|nr:hypothetical protein BSL78_28725 [Apostichopus japonicus]